MKIFDRENFIDHTARKPSGKAGRRSYAHPRAHYPSFRVMLSLLSLTLEDNHLRIFLQIKNDKGLSLSNRKSQFKNQKSAKRKSI